MPTPASLREDALHQLRLAGLDPVRIPGRKHLYRLSDGTIVLTRTAPRGWLVTKTATDAEDSPLLIDGEHEFVVVAVAHPRGGPTDVYKIPTPRLVADMQEAHRVYLVEHPNAANKNLRQIFFNGGQLRDGRENPLRGFGEKYREFLLLSDDDLHVAPNSGVEDMPQTPLARALAQARVAASAEYGQPVDHIRISLSVMFRTGELVFHFPN
jgi:hypothetical protein